MELSNRIEEVPFREAHTDENGNFTSGTPSQRHLNNLNDYLNFDVLTFVLLWVVYIFILILFGLNQLSNRWICSPPTYQFSIMNETPHGQLYEPNLLKASMKYT
ncbi:uncharacterized protein NPIL_440331 [Nephila pilipes]|uniref:Uncharacterized protein n=1 Tax=Nephila pilipes TaxID=299642 RepID=A0A8X6NFZ7_NEPPI|nr:uncharacterized protein NPIL_440331 [Nephila pilipes]